MAVAAIKDLPENEADFFQVHPELIPVWKALQVGISTPGNSAQDMPAIDIGSLLPTGEELKLIVVNHWRIDPVVFTKIGDNLWKFRLANQKTWHPIFGVPLATLLAERDY